MFCTGGVRCEKASSYLIKLGYKNVYQLNGGIVSYLKETKNKNKKWSGECFVFDERVAICDDLSKGQYDQCYACRSAINEDDKNLLTIKKEYSVQNVKKLHLKNKKKDLKREADKLF